MKVAGYFRERKLRTYGANRMKWVYRLDEGNKSMSSLLGGKGANLAEMLKHNLPVPGGFVITTEACNAYLDADRTLPSDLWEQVQDAFQKLQEKTAERFVSNGDWPLIVSVRSGAAISMPGMMETILNVGLNFNYVEHLSQAHQQHTFAYDSFFRLIKTFW